MFGVGVTVGERTDLLKKSLPKSLHHSTSSDEEQVTSQFSPGVNRALVEKSNALHHILDHIDTQTIYKFFT